MEMMMMRRRRRRRMTTRALWKVMLVGSLAVGVSPHSSVAADTTLCPSATISSPEGSSKVIAANVSTYPNMLVLCKNNCSLDAQVKSDCTDILILKKGDPKYMHFAYIDHFYISGKDLAIKNASKMLTGCYQLANDIDRSCVQKFYLRILDPWHCSSANFSLSEDSDEIIVANMSSSSHVLDLYKKENCSSGWQHILSITNGQPNYVRKDYKCHFLISEGGLHVKNATEGLTGEYQLVERGNESCVQQFFLDVSGSEAAGYSTYLIIGISALVLIPLALGLWYSISQIRKRRKGNRYESAHNSTRVPDSSNEHLQNKVCTCQGNKMNGHIQKMQQESIL